MTAIEDPELWPWLKDASRYGGSFIKSIADAGLRADSQNYVIVRDCLLYLKEKYPHYGTKEWRGEK